LTEVDRTLELTGIGKIDLMSVRLQRWLVRESTRGVRELDDQINEVTRYL
jgi:hypothetical protein